MILKKENIDNLSPIEKRALLKKLLQERAAQPQTHPLSLSQERIWFIEQLQPNTAVFNIARAFQIKGVLNVAALQTAVSKLVTRHSALRTTITTQEGVPHQLVSPATSQLAQQAAQLHISAHSQQNIDQLTHHPFNLQTEPLVRFHLLQQDAQTYTLLILLHHLIADEWSLDILYRELSDAYQAAGQNSAPPAGAYHQFARWQRNNAPASETEAFWQQQLAHATQLTVPTDAPRPAQQTFAGTTHSFMLPASLTQQLRLLAQQAQLTPYTLLSAVFALFLHKLSGQTDITFGVPLAQRPSHQFQQMIGTFVNMLPLRVHLEENQTFEQFLQVAEREMANLQRHRSMPLERLLEKETAQRDLSHNPLFQTALVWQSRQNGRFTLPNLQLTPLTLPRHTAKYDLTLFVQDTLAQWSLTFEFNHDLFKPSTISRWADHFVTLLTNIANNPKQTTISLSLLSPAEQQQILVNWNKTATVWENNRFPHQIVADHAAAHPNKLAIAEANLTYGDLNRRANQLAHWLISQGVRPENTVALLLPRSAALIIAQLAALKAGATFLPIDPSYPTERINHILEDALTNDETVLIADEFAQTIIAKQKNARPWSMVNFSSINLNDFSTVNPKTFLDFANLAYLIYTSGSTGHPKGVQLTHRGLHNLIQWHIHTFGLTAADHTTHLANVAFDAAVWEIWPALAAGATLHLPSEETRRSPWLLRDYIVQNSITVSFAPTPLAETMLTINWPPTSPLHTLLTGGDRLRHQPPANLPFTVINNYGPTEATVVATSQPLPTGNGQLAIDRFLLPPIGRPLPNATAHILDSHLNLVPVGVVGELFIGGNGLARAYHNQPALTAENFIPNPFQSDIPTNRLYRTGDLARYLPDGTIEFVGRRDSQIKIRGHRIELGEIEALLKEITAVTQAIVLHHANQLFAFLITDQMLNLPKLRHALASRLPSYMLPHHINLLPQLPLTPHGKVDHKTMLATVKASTTQPQNKEDGLQMTERVIPASPIEETLLVIWVELLNQPKIGRFDNFFTLGGDSILAIQIVARARAANLNLQPHHLFQHPTIAELAEVAQQLSQTAASPTKLSRSVPLSPIQQWFFAQNFAKPAHWNMPIVLQTPASTRLDLLETAVNHLIIQHAALRLRFRQTSSGLKQFYADPHTINIEQIVLPPRHDPQTATVETAHLKAANASLDLAAGPLMRLLHLRHADATNGRLHLIIHHLLVDGVSWRILLQDLTTLYHQLINNQPMQLPSPSSSFQQWTHHLAKTAVTQANPTFWQMHKLISSKSQLTVNPSTSDTSSIKKSTKTIYTSTPPSLNHLLTALAAALAAQTSASNFTIALEGHGREHLNHQLDLSRTVGWFTSLFPFPLPMQGTLDQKLAIIQQRRHELPHKGLDFGWAFYYGDEQIRDVLGKLPTPPISFNYLGQFDQFLPSNAPFKLLDSLPVHARAANNKRPFPIQINAHWQNGRLHLSIIHQHNEPTIQQLSTDFQNALIELANHPQAKAPSHPNRAARPQSPTTEYPLQNIGYDAHSLAPAQETMLNHTATHPNSTAYRLQWSHRLEGLLHIDAFCKAWQQTLARYDTFRKPLIIDYSATQHDIWTILDWRKHSEAEQQSNLTTFLQTDQQASFYPDTPPIRFALIRLSDTTTQFIWTIHHALIDGWSLAPLWRELFKRYAALLNGRSVTLSPVTPFQTYLDWRTKQNWQPAQTYWQTILNTASFPSNTQYQIPNSEHTLTLSEAETSTLTTFAKQQHLTLNTLLLGAWLQAWGKIIGQTDFLFGVTTSGRPAMLPDVDNIVGPFINTLPLRARLWAKPPLEWLPKLQQQLVLHRQHDAAAPSQLRQWLGLSQNQPLFDGFFRFQNYPAKRLLEQHSGNFRIAHTSLFDRWHHPLSIIAVPGNQLMLKAAWHNGRFSTQTIHATLNAFQTILHNIGAK